jgi:hypothetical protein
VEYERRAGETIMANSEASVEELLVGIIRRLT